MLTFIGRASAEDEWDVTCETCGDMLHFSGWFDSGDVEHCPRCGTAFRVGRIEFEDGSYIE